jgi:long-subunit acyl-CoA synthetase (AMP-forming)
MARWGGWSALTWGQYEQAVAEVAAALKARKVQAGDRVAILAVGRAWPALFGGPFFEGVVLVGRHLSRAERVAILHSVLARSPLSRCRGGRRDTADASACLQASFMNIFSTVSSG